MNIENTGRKAASMMGTIAAIVAVAVVAISCDMLGFGRPGGGDPGTSGPAYVIASVSFPSNGSASGTFSGSFSLANLGSVDGRDTISWQIWVSSDQQQDRTDTEAAAGNVGALAQGTTSADIHFSGSWPASTGTYYLVLTIVAGDDSTPSDNAKASPGISVGAQQSSTGVDYIVQSPSYPSSVYTGGALSGTFVMKNQGSTAGAVAVTWSIYQSTDTVYDAGDVELDTGTTGALAAGGTSTTVAHSGTWGGTAGSFYILIVLSASDDLNGSNNTASSSTITVGTAYVDLAVTSATFPSGPAQVTSAISGSFTVNNQGNIGQAGTTAWTVYWSPNSDPANVGSDIVVDSGTLSAMNAGASQTVSFSGFWPTIPGTYYLKAILTISDNNSTNDYAVSGAITVNSLNATFFALENYSAPKVWKTTDGGATFATISSPNINSSGDSGITSDGNGNLVIAGSSAIVYSGDSGATWYATTTGPGNGDYLHDVTTDRAGTWVAAGGCIYMGGATCGSKVIVSTDNGANWAWPSTAARWTSGDIYAVATDRNGVWIAVGQSGQIFRSTSPGSSWQQVAAPTNIDFDSVTTDGAGHWVAAGTDRNSSPNVGVIYYSSDGGATFFQDQTALSPANPDVAWVATDRNGTWIAVASDPNVIGGGLSYVSTDNGQSWSEGGTYSVNFSPFTGEEGMVATDGNGV